jgi:hypothetical protein
MNIGTKFYIISAYKSDLSREENQTRQMDLHTALCAPGCTPKIVDGSYQGVAEVSNVVVGPDQASVLELAEHFQQESILEVSPGREAYLIFTDGRLDQYLGEWRGQRTRPTDKDFTFDRTTQTYYTIGG